MTKDAVNQIKAYITPGLVSIMIAFGSWLGTEIYKTTKETAKEVAALRNDLIEIKVKLGYTEDTVKGHSDEIKELRSLLSANLYPQNNQTLTETR